MKDLIFTKKKRDKYKIYLELIQLYFVNYCALQKNIILLTSNLEQRGDKYKHKT